MFRLPLLLAALLFRRLGYDEITYTRPDVSMSTLLGNPRKLNSIFQIVK